MKSLSPVPHRSHRPRIPRRAPSAFAALVALVVVSGACRAPGSDGDGDAGTRSAGGDSLPAAHAPPRSGAVASGDERPDSATVPVDDTVRVLVYKCDRMSFTVSRAGGNDAEAEVLLPDRRLVLARVRSASGTRYESDGVVFWSKGDSARLETPRGTWPECVRDRRAESYEAARLRGARFRALGQEPGWLLDIYPTGERPRLHLVADYGELELTMPLSEPRVDHDAGTRTYRTATDSHRLEAVIEERSCTDAMSGFAFPRTVTLTLDGRTLEGCGRPLGPAFTGSWSLLRFGAGAGAVDPVADTSPALELDVWGRTAAVTGCNGLSGEWTSAGPGGLTFGPLTGTKRACSAPLMAQERRFADALASTRGYRIASDTLRLTGAAGDTLAVLRLEIDPGA